MGRGWQAGHGEGRLLACGQCCCQLSRAGARRHRWCCLSLGGPPGPLLRGPGQTQSPGCSWLRAGRGPTEGIPGPRAQGGGWPRAVARTHPLRNLARAMTWAELEPGPPSELGQRRATVTASRTRASEKHGGSTGAAGENETQMKPDTNRKKLLTSENKQSCWGAMGPLGDGHRGAGAMGSAVSCVGHESHAGTSEAGNTLEVNRKYLSPVKQQQSPRWALPSSWPEPGPGPGTPWGHGSRATGAGQHLPPQERADGPALLSVLALPSPVPRIGPTPHTGHP